MSYELKVEIPSINDYINIRMKAGLSEKSKEAAAAGLPNSIYSVVVYYQSLPIGIGRVIGDGGCFFEITDMAVLPDHQGKGVGRMIMETLVRYLKQNAPKTAFISLFADHGAPEFYSKFGFSHAELPKSSGMYLRIQ